MAVSTSPANEWGPDETLHAWEIVMFKRCVNDLLEEQLTPTKTVAPLSQPASPAAQYTTKRTAEYGHQVSLSVCLLSVNNSAALPG